jgi:activator of 2-hydroxyglutaryl-CoA dehydratase
MSGIESAAAATAAFSMGIDAGKSQTKVVLQEQGQHLSVAALVSHVIHVKPE